MKITRRQLRQIIRESLIKELTPDIITDPGHPPVASNQIASANAVRGVADTIADAVGLRRGGIHMKAIENKLANEPVEFVVSLGTYTTEELTKWYKEYFPSEPGTIEELISKQLRQIIKEEIQVHQVPVDLDAVDSEEAYGIGYMKGTEQDTNTDDDGCGGTVALSDDIDDEGPPTSEMPASWRQILGNTLGENN